MIGRLVLAAAARSLRPMCAIRQLIVAILDMHYPPMARPVGSFRLVQNVGPHDYGVAGIHNAGNRNVTVVIIKVEEP